MTMLSEYKGVRGWLFLLYVKLTFLGPLFTVINISSGYSELAPIFDQYPRMLPIYAIDSILRIGLKIFGIYAGVALKSIRPNAVMITKKYFIFLLCYSMLAIFLPFMAGFSSEGNQAMLNEGIKEACKAFIAFAICYSYLLRSKRVKATYGVASC